MSLKDIIENNREKYFNDGWYIAEIDINERILEGRNPNLIKLNKIKYESLGIGLPDGHLRDEGIGNEYIARKYNPFLKDTVCLGKNLASYSSLHLNFSHFEVCLTEFYLTWEGTLFYGYQDLDGTIKTDALTYLYQDNNRPQGRFTKTAKRESFLNYSYSSELIPTYLMQAHQNLTVGEYGAHQFYIHGSEPIKLLKYFPYYFNENQEVGKLLYPVNLTDPENSDHTKQYYSDFLFINQEEKYKSKVKYCQWLKYEDGSFTHKNVDLGRVDNADGMSNAQKTGHLINLSRLKWMNWLLNKTNGAGEYSSYRYDYLTGGGNEWSIADSIDLVFAHGRSTVPTDVKVPPYFSSSETVRTYFIELMNQFVDRPETLVDIFFTVEDPVKDRTGEISRQAIWTRKVIQKGCDISQYTNGLFTSIYELFVTELETEALEEKISSTRVKYTYATVPVTYTGAYCLKPLSGNGRENTELKFFLGHLYYDQRIGSDALCFNRKFEPIHYPAMLAYENGTDGAFNLIFATDYSFTQLDLDNRRRKFINKALTEKEFNRYAGKNDQFKVKGFDRTFFMRNMLEITGHKYMSQALALLDSDNQRVLKNSTGSREYALENYISHCIDFPSVNSIPGSENAFGTFSLSEITDELSDRPHGEQVFSGVYKESEYYTDPDQVDYIDRDRYPAHLEGNKYTEVPYSKVIVDHNELKLYTYAEQVELFFNPKPFGKLIPIKLKESLIDEHVTLFGVNPNDFRGNTEEEKLKRKKEFLFYMLKEMPLVGRTYGFDSRTKELIPFMPYKEHIYWFNFESSQLEKMVEDNDEVISFDSGLYEGCVGSDLVKPCDIGAMFLSQYFLLWDNGRDAQLEGVNQTDVSFRTTVIDHNTLTENAFYSNVSIDYYYQNHHVFKDEGLYQPGVLKEKTIYYHLLDEPTLTLLKESVKPGEYLDFVNSRAPVTVPQITYIDIKLNYNRGSVNTKIPVTAYSLREDEEYSKYDAFIKDSQVRGNYPKIASSNLDFPRLPLLFNRTPIYNPWLQGGMDAFFDDSWIGPYLKYALPANQKQHYPSHLDALKEHIRRPNSLKWVPFTLDDFANYIYHDNNSHMNIFTYGSGDFNLGFLDIYFIDSDSNSPTAEELFRQEFPDVARFKPSVFNRDTEYNLQEAYHLKPGVYHRITIMSYMIEDIRNHWQYYYEYVEQCFLTRKIVPLIRRWKNSTHAKRMELNSSLVFGHIDEEEFLDPKNHIFDVDFVNGVKRAIGDGIRNRENSLIAPEYYNSPLFFKINRTIRITNNMSETSEFTIPSSESKLISCINGKGFRERDIFNRMFFNTRSGRYSLNHQDPSYLIPTTSGVGNFAAYSRPVSGIYMDGLSVYTFDDVMVARYRNIFSLYPESKPTIKEIYRTAFLMCPIVITTDIPMYHYLQPYFMGVYFVHEMCCSLSTFIACFLDFQGFPLKTEAELREIRPLPCFHMDFNMNNIGNRLTVEDWFKRYFDDMTDPVRTKTKLQEMVRDFNNHFVSLKNSRRDLFPERLAPLFPHEEAGKMPIIWNNKLHDPHRLANASIAHAEDKREPDMLYATIKRILLKRIDRIDPALFRNEQEFLASTGIGLQYFKFMVNKQLNFTNHKYGWDLFILQDDILGATISGENPFHFLKFKNSDETKHALIYMKKTTIERLSVMKNSQNKWVRLPEDIAVVGTPIEFIPPVLYGTLIEAIKTNAGGVWRNLKVGKLVDNYLFDENSHNTNPPSIVATTLDMLIVPDVNLIQTKLPAINAIYSAVESLIEDTPDLQERNLPSLIEQDKVKGVFFL